MKFILTINDVVWLETMNCNEAFDEFRRWAGAVEGANAWMRLYTPDCGPEENSRSTTTYYNIIK